MASVESEATTLVELLEQAAREWGPNPAVRLHGEDGWGWTYGELYDASRRAAAYLLAQGVAKGDRVVLWGPNRPEWIAAFFGVQIAGAIAVPLDVRSREELLSEIERQTQPVHMFAGREQLEQLGVARAAATALEDLPPLLASLSPAPIGTGAVVPEDLAELVFTSGTTGDPKGVILTQRNITANVWMSRPGFKPSPKNRILSILPLSHMFEQAGGMFVPLIGGASITHVSSLRPDVIFDAIRENRITNMSCVPQVLSLFRDGVERELRRQGRAEQFERLHRLAQRLPLPVRRLLFRSLLKRMGGAFEYFVSGGAYLDPELARWWEGVGIKVAQGYGTTEASPVISTNTVHDRDFFSVGRPVRGLEVRIDEDKEILIRGPNVTPGYWQNPATTAEALVDGWYRTGDLGSLDGAGRLHLIGRKKNLIVLANGLNVYPEDIEHVLAHDPRLKDAVVLGLTRGQDVELHAVLLTDQPEAAGDIVRRANARLAPHQQIRRHTVWPEDSFPVTPTLKPKRAVIAERLASVQQGERA
jgi:long-chain acyl-CoA synthetase